MINGHRLLKILTKIQGLFKNFKDRHETQGFFQGCGKPVLVYVNVSLPIDVLNMKLYCIH